MTTAAQAIKNTVSTDGRTATVSIPVTFLQRGGRKHILTRPEQHHGRPPHAWADRDIVFPVSSKVCLIGRM
jgi:hypothetical protein